MTTSVSAFDQRIIEVEIVLPDQTFTFTGDMAICASGIKFGSANQNTCECRIYNLRKELRNTILTLASPLVNPNNPQVKRVPVVLNLRVGRESYGTFLLFSGNVIACNVTQPPDIGITLVSLTNNAFMSLILNLQQPAITQLSEICKSIADTMGLFLDFEATDKQIDNFSFTGAAQNLIPKINQMGVQAFVDNGSLVVLDPGQARKGANILISQSTGMVGIPQVTEQGVIVKTMLNNAIYLGGSVTIDSIINPAANGTYKVVKINYDIASREQPFWYTLECSNLAIYQGNVG